MNRFAHLLDRRLVRIAFSIAGLFATYGLMAGFDLQVQLGTVAFAPWIALLGFDLGELASLPFAVAAVGFWELATLQNSTVNPTWVQIVIRLGILAVLGIGSGMGGRRLRESERSQRLVAALQSSLIDATLDGICLTDAEGNVLISNRPLRQISGEMGLPPTGTVPERLIAISHRMTEPERYRERMETLARTPDAVSVDEFELKGSGRVFRGYTAPVENPDGSFAGRIWTLREVTADRELDRLRDAFVAAVSHELRTPLTSISGFLELLSDEEEALGESGRNYLSVIRRSTGRLQRIVEDLLLVAQIEARRLELRPTPIDLAELAAAAAESARPAAEEKGVALELRSDDSPPVHADGLRMSQVVDNLVSNAIKFTERGGTVTVSTSADESWARISVADTGVGIPASEQEQLFSRFFRASTATRRAIPGTGLGLAIAQAIVEEHGGSISLQSQEGAGTTVTVTLPVRVPAEVQAGGA
ncbi:MAG TPA: ATP-binding protein [Gaiellaceae bacterium]|nr:ATP-binding protein [Gaiellaceae bacterium]